MSSVVVFTQSGVVAQWNKNAAYSVTDSAGKVTRHASETQAIRAAKRRAQYLKRQGV